MFARQTKHFLLDETEYTILLRNDKKKKRVVHVKKNLSPTSFFLFKKIIVMMEDVHNVDKKNLFFLTGFLSRDDSF